ncbi:MAG: hypothetical protein ACOVLB_01845 [Candidatus Nanopelagicus sp.]
MSYSITTSNAAITGTFPLTVGSVSGVGSSSIDWLNNITVGINPALEGQSLEVKGDANFTGEVTIKGKKLSEVLDNIESRLAILHPNKELEEKWENLRVLREAYVALEKEILEKEAMWAILKR